MRDLIVAGIVFGALPFILARPHIGVLVWSWLGYMNPHRLTYGFAFSFPFSMVVAATTIVALLFSAEKKRMPWHPTTVIWLLLVVWLNVTTVFALNYADAVPAWDRAMKIMLIVLVTLLVMTSKERIQSLVWIISLSLGFFGVKGGLFSLATGGSYKVWGPANSFIEDNNALALALVMTIPLMRYLHLTTTNKHLRRGLLVAMMLSAISILTSFSRGALLASTAMVLFLAWNSRFRVRTFAVLLIVVPIILSLMPQEWWDRMNTINTYQQDDSALGRINAWNFAYNLALDHPLVGGGFNTFSPDLFFKYAPNPTDFHDAHSIYFQMLGEHGFIGLALFLALGVGLSFTGLWIKRHTKDRPDLSWAHDLASMLQVSLVGYAVGGAFLGLAYYDLFYHIMALMILTRVAVRDVLAQEQPKPHFATPGR